jgi:lysozyme family protein
MKTVEQIATEIVAREGGYVNDTDDPGGATKHGVTVGTMRRLGLDLTGDGLVTPADVRALDRDRATTIFIEHYWRRPRVCDLPPMLHPTVFDMYVNAGSNAVRLLQRLFRDMRIEVTVDGIIGPRTIASAASRRLRHRTISSMPMGSPAATTTTLRLTADRPAENTPDAATGERVGGSCAPRNSCRPAIT